ncbi:LOW QUALITY PROTEIN: T-cell surface glycoprotein CD8 beta chain-like [Heliangelus exortis]|uniref:LOW QUALITY PROTEIN: T-cell surface glycoprotein CD8 beta chain-like n=1 Tax=Heliangelus exortis TaxID=472823 RepID=UPI003A91534D
MNLFLSQTPEHILAQTSNRTEILCELKKESAGVYWYCWSQERQNCEFLLFSNLLSKATRTLVLCVGTDTNQDKFRVHRVSPSTSYRLHISHLHTSDNGTYCCSISQSSQLLLGTGTRLVVGKHHPQGSKMCHQQAEKRSPGQGVTCVADVLPLPLKTTLAPSSQKPMLCITKSKAASKKGTESGWLVVLCKSKILEVLLRTHNHN